MKYLENYNDIMNIIIIGGGPTGLMSCIKLKKLYPDATIIIYDKRNYDKRSEVILTYVS